MGFFPIFVALGAFVLLYSIYTYNQIKPKKVALTRVIDQMSKVSSERKNLILTHDRANENSALSNVAQELMRTSTDRFQSFKKENELIDKTKEGVSALEAQNVELSQQITELNNKQLENMDRLRNSADHYNRFIKKAPTKFIASLFGFKTF